jgi:V-type H+-transporting ATPase subunit a
MVLSPGSVDNEHQNVLYKGQSFVQVVLLMLAGICVPWMLCAKPYLLWRDHQNIVKAGYDTVGGSSHDEDVEDHANGNGEMSHGEHVRSSCPLCNH